MPVFPGRSVQRCRNSDVHESLTHVSQQVKSDKSLPTQDQVVQNDKRLTTRGSVVTRTWQNQATQNTADLFKKTPKALRPNFTKSCLREMTDNSDEDSVVLALTTPARSNCSLDRFQKDMGRPSFLVLLACSCSLDIGRGVDRWSTGQVKN